LTIQEMKRVAELGVEVEISASTAVQAPAAEAPVAKSGVRQMEVTQACVMEMDRSGYFHEVGVTKSAWQCLGCGLVWAIKWHSETCESRGHKAQWQQMYCQGTENGKPINPRYFPRIALRREAVA
jgi:hypothetical protein